MTEKDFFVGIHEPLDVRRNLLECSREIVNSLKSNEKITRIRKEKLHNFEKMKTIMSELDLIISQLKTKLPKSNLRKSLDNNRIPIVSAKTTSSTAEMKELDNQLKDIEKEFSKIKLS